MQPNIIERVWRQDKMVNVDVLNGFVFTGEVGAHKFVISGKNVNTPVDISGTITANFKNAVGVLVPLTGTIEDGKAVVVLSRECYAVEGPFSLMIFADTVCIYAAIANAINSSGEVIAYPTATIPSVQELIEEVQDVIASIPQDYSALSQNVTDLKSATDSLTNIVIGKNKCNELAFEAGMLNPSTGVVDTTVSGQHTTDFITIPSGAVNIIPSAQSAGTRYVIYTRIVFYHANKTFLSGAYSGSTAIAVPDGAAYVRVTFYTDNNQYSQFMVEFSSTTTFGTYYPYQEIKTDNITEINFGRFEQFYIKNGMLTGNNDHINNDGRVAKYVFADLGADCKMIKCKALFNGGSIALISEPNGRNYVHDITRGSVHVVFYNTSVIVGLFINGTLETIGTKTYTISEMNAFHECGYRIDDSAITIYMPDGNTVQFTDDRISAANGKFVCWEITNLGVVPTQYPTDEWEHGKFAAFYAEPVDGIPLMDTFDRNDGFIGVARTGHVYSLCRNMTTGDDEYSTMDF